MSGLGSTSEDIMLNALSLVEHHIAVATNVPVGVLTAGEVRKLNDELWKKVVDHVRIHGEGSVQLVSDQDFSGCGGTEDAPESFYLGTTLIAAIEYQGDTPVPYILRSEVPMQVLKQFIQLVGEKVHHEKEARGEDSHVCLRELRKRVEERRIEIEEAALEACTQLRREANGELVGYILTEGQFGTTQERFQEITENREDSYRSIRQGAKPVFQGEMNLLRTATNELITEEHFIGKTVVALHRVERDEGKVQKKQYFILGISVPLQDYHRFLQRLRDLLSKIKVVRKQKDVENIYWAGKPKRTKSDIPMFGFD
ncbi:MAG: hypothetical protein KDD60_03010 [Bdellovibrionales bacterium]|nr:hypothetical protein [Bdellovibrionales bacterium]